MPLEGSAYLFPDPCSARIRRDPVSIIELLFIWCIATLLGIAAIIVAEPLWSSREDGASIESEGDSKHEIDRRD